MEEMTFVQKIILDSDCESFKQAIISNLRSDREDPIFEELEAYSWRVNSWEPEYAQKIINELKTRGEVITKKINGYPRYFLVKS
ncbi:MAG: hypothetical protein DRH26_00020 [Deltaproteobacteria bacterium]|nr:MAG: hypothetical protein DRH26_00020 [Deltaproteobacteria bacterium]